MAQSMTDEDRIRHYIALSLDAGASPAERDLAAQRAERLMVRLGIDSIPALYLFKDGKTAETMIGYHDKKAIADMIARNK